MSTKNCIAKCDGHDDDDAWKRFTEWTSWEIIRLDWKIKEIIDNYDSKYLEFSEDICIKGLIFPINWIEENFANYQILLWHGTISWIQSIGPCHTGSIKLLKLLLNLSLRLICTILWAFSKTYFLYCLHLILFLNIQVYRVKGLNFIKTLMAIFPNSNAKLFFTAIRSHRFFWFC